MRPNVELLERTLEYVIAHPEEHAQDWWRHKTACGTTMCFAGHAVSLVGSQWLAHGDHSFALVPWPEEGMKVRYDSANYCWYTPVSKRAQSVLGLTEQQAHTLFLKASTLAEVKDVVHAIIAGEPLPVLEYDLDDVEAAVERVAGLL